MTILGIIILIGFIPVLVCILGAFEEDSSILDEQALDSYLKFIVIPQYGLYVFAKDSVRTSGIIVLMVFSTLIFFPYNIILAGVSIVRAIGYYIYKIFMRLFGKKEEEEE